MATYIDGVLKEWGDRLYFVTIKGRAAPKTVCGHRPKSAAPKAGRVRAVSAVREALVRTAKKMPEVMVKISGGGKDMRGIKAHMDYISRNGDVPLQDETGQAIEGREAVRELRDDWTLTGGKAIPYEEGYRREAFNIILSMPPGTDRDGVRAAAAEFAAVTFEGHQYVFASHDDEKHPHVHLCVKTLGRDLIRLNPRKADLQRWRETFAEKLREHGIEANATARAPRGRTLRAEKQAVRHIDEGFKKKTRSAPSRVKTGRELAVRDEIVGGTRHDHPAEAKLAQQRREVVKSYGQIAKALSNSPDTQDKKLAMQIVGLVRGMQPPKTAHRRAVEKYQQQHSTAGYGRAVERDDRGSPGST